MNSVYLPSRHDRISRAHAVVPVTAMPASKWPIWASALAFFKSTVDVGVGDTVERIIGKTNSAGFKKWHLKTFGKTCGCTDRKRDWNAKFPYEHT